MRVYSFLLLAIVSCVACGPLGCTGDGDDADGGVAPVGDGDGDDAGSDAGVTPGISACAPQIAQYEGGCEAANRYHWNGWSCFGISGCTCTGQDCQRGHASMEACEAA